MVEIFAYSLVVILILCVVALAWRSEANHAKALDQLMLFHEGGRSLVNHELEMARIEIEKRKTDLEIKRLEVRKVEATNPSNNRRMPVPASAGMDV
jgi:hypothetical protein